MEYLCAQYHASERHSCRLIKICRSSHRYQKKNISDKGLRLRIQNIAKARPRFGYKRIYIMLRREGWKINHKRVHRFYVEMNLQLKKKTKKKRASHMRIKQGHPQKLNQRWSMDFVSDVLQEGQRFRILTIVDLFSKECRMLKADTSLTAQKVVSLLEELRHNGQVPEAITVDNGSEFASKKLDAGILSWRKVRFYTAWEAHR